MSLKHPAHEIPFDELMSGLTASPELLGSRGDRQAWAAANARLLADLAIGAPQERARVAEALEE